jgi:hypothetical protein
MSLLTLVWFQLDTYLFRRRWLLSPGVALLVAFTAVDNLQMHVINYAKQPNIWDVLFRIWLNHHFHFFVSNVLFVFLVSDISVTTAWEDALLLRIQSRRMWWLSKVLLLAICTVAYFGILVGAALAVGGASFPWKVTWSDAAVTCTTNWDFNPTLLRYSPYSAFALTGLLAVLGWFSLGLFASMICLATGKFVWGFIGATSANFVGLLALLKPIAPPYSYLPFQYHFLINYHAFGDSTSAYPSIQISLLYWMIVISLLFMAGLWLSSRHDFFRYGL